MSVVTPSILSQGSAMDPAYQLLSIDISKEVNRIGHAELTVIDGDVAKGTFPISDGEFFALGKEIEIKLRLEEENSEATVFKGLVTGQILTADEVGTRLLVELKDAAVKLTQGRKSSVFLDKSDDKIIAEIVQENGLKKGSIETTQPQHPQIVQYYCTDWDFVLSRADIQGLLVVVDDGEISLAKMGANGKPKHQFEYGISEIFDFELELDGSGQYPGVESVAWDAKAQKLTPVKKAKAVKATQGNLDGAKIAKSLGFATCMLSHPVPVDDQELQVWADGRLARNRLSMIRGRIAVPGMADIKPLDVIELTAVGERFEGKTVVTGIRHRVDAEGWRTDVQFGLSKQWFCRQPDIADAPAAGLLPGVSGLQIGVVDAFEEDPDKEFRVKVILPGIDEQKGAVWARLLSPDAGPERGYFFRPETGDEVVVGFFNNDPRQPVVLGAMYGSKNAPPKDVSELSAENINKAIVSRSGTTIGFVDAEKASVFIQTPEKNKILLDDDAQMIQITDQHGNSLTMDANGIEIKSAKDVKVDASGNVEIKGQKVDVK